MYLLVIQILKYATDLKYEQSQNISNTKSFEKVKLNHVLCAKTEYFKEISSYYKFNDLS